MQVSTVAARRDLTLIQLHGHGLRRLGASRAELIDSEVWQYARTAAWAAALHFRREGADGLIWVSRKFDTAFALVLFGDRVVRSDIEVIEHPLPLFLGDGYAEIQRIAGLASITIIE
jgi:hypothetical protein